MANGRCRMHGGPSTGPQSAEGKARSSQNRLLHGRYSREAIQEQRESRELLRQCREFLVEVAKGCEHSPDVQG